MQTANISICRSRGNSPYFYVHCLLITFLYAFANLMSEIEHETSGVFLQHLLPLRWFINLWMLTTGTWQQLQRQHLACSYQLPSSLPCYIRAIVCSWNSDHAVTTRACYLEFLGVSKDKLEFPNTWQIFVRKDQLAGRINMQKSRQIVHRIFHSEWLKFYYLTIWCL